MSEDRITTELHAVLEHWREDGANAFKYATGIDWKPIETHTHLIGFETVPQLVRPARAVNELKKFAKIKDPEHGLIVEEDKRVRVYAAALTEHLYRILPQADLRQHFQAVDRGPGLDR